MTQDYNKIYNLVAEEISAVQAKVFEVIPKDSRFNEEIVKFLFLPAKHIRAVVSFLYLKSLNVGINNLQICYQAIIELIHNASLIHDDIIDNSQERRNKPSFNKQFGNHLAVIGGDLLLAGALNEITKLENSYIQKILAETFFKMCNGEIMQYSKLYQIPTLDEYIEKTYNKTGMLFESALIGAMHLAGCENLSDAKKFAKSFGIAFQMNNDIKNIISLKQNEDIENGIYTSAVIYSQNPKNPKAGLEKAKILLDNYLGEAQSALSKLQESNYKTALLNLSELLRL